ncbi:Aspartyl/Asparaginyl beta-hydroxylase [compost metagenome]
MFLSCERFPFTRMLAEAWPRIRAEFEALDAELLRPWHERFLYDEGWEVFGLYALGRKLPEQCERVPETARAVERIPGMVTAGFSVMRPGTRIRPHRGYTEAVLRCHLGLIVPPGCGLRVGGELRQWQEGQCLVFDDTAEHEAWNVGTRSRVVLLVDFAKEA